MKLEDIVGKDAPILEEVTLQAIKFALVQHIPKNTYPQRLELEGYDDYLRDYFIRQLSWHLWGKKIETITYPRTWWDAFKNYWFPKWLRKRYPPSFDTFQLYNICPHISFDWKNHSDLHIQWLEKNHGFEV